MTYGVLVTVQSILQDSSSKYEAEITECIVSGDAYVDSLLVQVGLTVPTPTPQNITDASNYYAAWIFRKRRDPQSAWIFYLDAEKFKDAYIKSQQVSSSLGVVKANDVGDDLED